jgi:hypothetical protein
METATAPQKHPSAIRFLAHFFSVVFHPLFLSTYVAAFLIYMHPYAFAGVGDRLKFFKLVMVFFNTAFVPMFAVFLMWRLGLIQSVLLRTTKERLIPYMAAMVCYFWAAYVTRKNVDNPQLFVDFMEGSFAAVVIAWFCNIYFKVSMHTTAAGGVLTFFLLQTFLQQEDTAIYLSIALLVAGVVGTARMIVSDHRPAEIYIGYFIGAVAQIVVLWL